MMRYSSTCTATMVLPPQTDGVKLKCDLHLGHSGLHTAPDPDGIMRRWPADGSPAALAAQATGPQLATAGGKRA